MEDLNIMLNNLSRFSERVDIKINTDKTKLMSNVHVVSTPVKDEGTICSKLWTSRYVNQV